MAEKSPSQYSQQPDLAANSCGVSGSNVSHLSNNAVQPVDSEVHRLQRAETITRYALVCAAVLLCYAFSWHWLERITADANSAADRLFGVTVERISPVAVVIAGRTFHYVTACTMADVFCGTIPLLWSLRRRWTTNVAILCAAAIALFWFNVLRLTLSDVLFAYGANWDLAHGIVAGLSYYVIWRLLERVRPHDTTVESCANVAIAYSQN